MENQNMELEHSEFQPKYAKRIRDGFKWRYFYSQEEYDAYLQNQRKKEAQPRVNQQRAQAHAQRLKEQSRKLKDAQNDKRLQAAQPRVNQQRAAARSQQLSSKSAEKPEEKKVGVLDYMFGGEAGKNLRQTRKDRRATKNELKKQQKQLKKLEKKLKNVSPTWEKGTYNTLTKTIESLNKSMLDNQIKLKDQAAKYASAKAEYEASTLLGSIGRNTRSSADIFKKYGRKSVSAINTPVIKTKKR